MAIVVAGRTPEANPERRAEADDDRNDERSRLPLPVVAGHMLAISGKAGDHARKRRSRFPPHELDPVGRQGSPHRRLL